MTDTMKIKFLRVALALFGLFFLFGLYPIMHYWPSGWAWSPAQPEYEQMIVGIYATLGVFLLLAIKNPNNHRSLIWFAVWSSAVHGLIMLVQAIRSPIENGHLFGDVPGLFLVAVVLAALMPQKSKN